MRSQFRRMSTAAALKVKERDLGKWTRPASAQPPAPPPPPPPPSPAPRTAQPAPREPQDFTKFLRWTPDMATQQPPAPARQPAPANAPPAARLSPAAQPVAGPSQQQPAAPPPRQQAAAPDHAGPRYAPLSALTWSPGDASSSPSPSSPAPQSSQPATSAQNQALPPRQQAAAAHTAGPRYAPSSALYWSPGNATSSPAPHAAVRASQPAASQVQTLRPAPETRPSAQPAALRPAATSLDIVWRPGEGTVIPEAVKAVREAFEQVRQTRAREEAAQQPQWQKPREPRLQDALNAPGLFGFADTRIKTPQRSALSAEDRRSKKNSEVVPKPKIKKPKIAKAKEVRATKDIFIPEVITVGNLAKVLNVELRRLQYAMVQAGMEENTDYDQVLSYEYASLLVQEFGKNAVMNEEAAFDIFPQPEPADKTNLPLRPPVVTIMGHVDHGKTTLLDTLRSTAVAKGEAGGITQHIGAFSVPVKGTDQTITFLDTPGHAAFSAMRARGASVTDIIVLVVAADDGVMAQTMEVIELIKKDADNAGVVVALNKCDRPGADPELVRLQLMAEGIELESLGGDIPAVEVSGLTGAGLDELVENISTVAELMDLRAERTGPAEGSIIESKVVQGIGPVATVLVHRGELLPGANLICGTTSARVRMMSDPSGQSVNAAYPGDAVTVGGWKDVPKAGDEVLQGTDKEVQRALANRVRRAQSATMLEDAQAINAYRRLAKEKREEVVAAAEDAKQKGAKQPVEEEKPAWKEDTGPKVLNIVVKADVRGSEEAVVGALQEIGNHQACTKIIHSAVGDVNESDVELAKTAGGMVVAFNVKCPRPIEVLANASGVQVFSSGIIYRCTDEIRARVSSLIPPIIEKKVIGEVNVLALFEISQRGKSKPLKVAGCRIANGVVQKTKLARVMRNREMIFEGPIETLRHHKEDVMEMKKGQDCGLSVKGFDDPQVGDVIQIYTIVEKPVML